MLPSQLRIENQVLDAQPLALRLFDGTATLRGHADFNDPDNATLRFAVNARGLNWGGANTTPKSPAQAASDTPAIVADADLGIAGTLQTGRRSARPRSPATASARRCSSTGAATMRA